MKERPSIIPEGAHGVSVYYPFEEEWYGQWIMLGDDVTMTEDQAIDWMRPTMEEIMAHTLVALLEDRINYRDLGDNYSACVDFSGLPVMATIFPDDIESGENMMPMYRENDDQYGKLVSKLALTREIQHLIKDDLQYEVKV